MTHEELIIELSEHLKDEFNDVINYINLSNSAASLGLEGPAQILKDIAHEEYLHAEHIENILQEMNALKENNLNLKKNAREVLDSL